MALDERAFEFVTSFVSRRVPSAASGLQQLKNQGGTGDEGEDLASLCKRVLTIGGPAVTNSLYGDDIKPEVDKWLSSPPQLRVLDSLLLTRAVMLGNGTSIGLADIAVYVSIHDEVAALSKAELNSYPNLLRWIDFVQHKDDESHAYEWIPIDKPKFDPPSQGASGEPDAKKGAVKEKEGGGGGGARNGPSVNLQQKQIKADKVETTPDVPLKEKKEPPKDSSSTGKVDSAEQVKKDAPSSKGKKDPAAPGAQKGKKESTAAAAPAAAPAPAQKDAFGFEILDIKVGVIKTVKRHPTAESLYVEEIDVGEGGLRQVVSGLAKFLTEDQMLNRRVLVLSNVKPSKLRDVLSSGLVLCTSNEDHSQCEPVIPPKEATIGERVKVAGYDGEPEAVLNPKKKQWDKLYPDLRTDDAGVACYKGIPLTTSSGHCTSSIVRGGVK